ncbi:RodZ domain-containing protein [Kangiella sediminilitoris]|uniref:Cytoskeleton protein RodZ-like C-terminal domain-containing protein n=1 Tax=Kangiella sediminilitoris TaxID=1144748 RepID=A0A1B3BC18_9GAMM|nr:RodZ domain-containing protein [Kangiella sediminilitoris]AOE50295.1 hypothetical protein KS2013_1585 [Kangiella sediminilitoris]
MTDNYEQSSKEHEFGPGALLKQAREEQGLSLKEVSTSLKLTMPVLEQIEADDYKSELPITFFRGYLKNYAELLKLEEVDIVANFQHYCEKHKLFSQPPPKLRGVEMEQPMTSSNWLFKVITGIIILILVAAIYYVVVEKELWKKVVPQDSEAEQATSSALLLESSEESTEGSEALVQDSESIQEDELAVEQEPLSTSSNQEASADSSQSGEINLTQEQAEDVDSSQTQTAAASTTSQSVLGKSLVLNFTSDCWVRIEDATGKVLALGIKQAGSDLQLSGETPYSLTLGKPSAVQLTFDGEAVDLSAYPDTRAAKLTLGDE